MNRLPTDISKAIDELCRKGDQFAEIDQFDDAIENYDRAWDLLPDPKQHWPAATWILMSLGDAYFALSEYAIAADILMEAIDCPDGGENPFVLLRLGQCLLELGQLDKAANSLESAFRRGGETIFQDEDSKYIDFVKTQLRIMQISQTGERKS